MANYLSDRTGANIDSVLDNADAGNIGKSADNTFASSESIGVCAFGRVMGDATGPTAGNYSALNIASSSTVQTLLAAEWSPTNLKLHARSQFNTYGPWQELYHTGNTGAATFAQSSFQGDGNKFVNISPAYTSALFDLGSTGNTLGTVANFRNSDGVAGSITTNGSVTAYNTSSDPRLKEFAATPTDSEVDAEFNSLFSCFRTFNWKNDLSGDLVWGFDAHACIDANLDMGSEGEGPRSLSLGDVYETIPAVTETRVVLDSEGKPTTETEEVVIAEAIEKKVTPAGVDQSKAVPILLAKIEQLERRLAAGGF